MGCGPAHEKGAGCQPCQEARYHGYELSVSADVSHKSIRKIDIGTVRRVRKPVFNVVFNAHNTSISADVSVGYLGKERSQILKMLSYREHVQLRDKGEKATESVSKGPSKHIAKVLIRIEYVCSRRCTMRANVIGIVGRARVTVAVAW